MGRRVMEIRARVMFCLMMRWEGRRTWFVESGWVDGCGVSGIECWQNLKLDT
jgi:hypothetical protein